MRILCQVKQRRGKSFFNSYFRIDTLNVFYDISPGKGNNIMYRSFADNSCHIQVEHIVLVKMHFIAAVSCNCIPVK